ncbi:hypothetical protein RUM44_009440 [Polyplax serrata]|uniref:Uncharacterized protein n=1 Tax=Polyplax serrata TaxID=468196 RepID=A0ABR1AU71_POLSC
MHYKTEGLHPGKCERRIFRVPREISLLMGRLRIKDETGIGPVSVSRKGRESVAGTGQRREPSVSAKPVEGCSRHLSRMLCYESPVTTVDKRDPPLKAGEFRGRTTNKHEQNMLSKYTNVS